MRKGLWKRRAYALGNCLKQEGSIQSITKAAFYYTKFALYKFLTKVLSLSQASPRLLPGAQILAECQVQFLIEICDLLIRTLGDCPAAGQMKVASLQMCRTEHHLWPLLIYSPVAIMEL